MQREHLLTITVLCILSAPCPAFTKDQNWTGNTVKLRVGKSLQVWCTQEIRSNDVTAYNDIFAKYIEFTLRHGPNKTFYWALRYRHQWNEKKNISIGEDRWVFEAGAKARAYPWLTLDMRLRFDGKNFDKAGVEDYAWYRLRLRSTVHTHIKRLRISPFLAMEPFGNTPTKNEPFINRHRLYAGSGIPIGNHFVLVMDYIRQDLRGRETEHILRTMFEWTI
jgi:hypothetical protein